MYPTKKHQPYPHLLTSLKHHKGPTQAQSHYREKCLQDSRAVDLQGRTIHVFTQPQYNSTITVCGFSLAIPVTANKLLTKSNESDDCLLNRNMDSSFCSLVFLPGICLQGNRLYHRAQVSSANDRSARLI